MGLGKTVQVLAMLESRRAAREAAADTGGPRPEPSLVVVPRSLVFNWKEEAARFTPKLRVLDHTGAGRSRPGEHFEDYDLVLTTYGTLRRDAPSMKDVRFDYVILDEAQAIKNAATESAKAARLLRGDHRLALSGTPVQNHLGELWSLFEFLNPGMLGAASMFGADGSGAKSLDADALAVVARALARSSCGAPRNRWRATSPRRPSRRSTASSIPCSGSSTTSCAITIARRSSTRSGATASAARRSRCWRRCSGSARRPAIPASSTARDSASRAPSSTRSSPGSRRSGKRATRRSSSPSSPASSPSCARSWTAAGIPYEYLDGRTRDRAARVERFQTDRDCLLFLVSLKAGGLGLNLTAAEYVFLLDPWWNPAVEAQAIDRTHRIGQTRPVFAYRLIARDTVEEKVLELQETKRALADSIISADESLIRTLTREDLELLLS